MTDEGEPLTAKERAVDRRVRARDRRKERDARKAKKQPRRVAAEPMISHGSADSAQPAAPLDNPYAPPKADLDEQPRPDRELRDAPKYKRFVNYVVDTLVAVLVSAGLTSVLLHLGLLAPDDFRLLAIEWLMPIAYYTIAEAVWGRTLGKLLTGTRVIAADGGPLTLPKALYRSLARLVPFEPLSILGQTNCGHDRWTGTRVVEASLRR